jgi:hypothetical protein
LKPIGQISWQPKIQEKEMGSRSHYNAIHEENLQIKQKCAQFELQTKKMAEEIRRMEKLHKQELRWRDKKKVGLVTGVALRAMVYVVLALTVRGFV